jgi:hypothetical protein
MPGATPSLHDWLIEEREYARQEERRGRRYAFETLDPRRTALVVVDMVPFFVSANRHCRGIVPNIAQRALHRSQGSGGVLLTIAVFSKTSPLRVPFMGPATPVQFMPRGA